MYCVKCGVSLSDSEKACPLCGTAVYHPELQQKDIAPPYPAYKKPQMRIGHRGVMFLSTVLYLMLIVQLLICDYSISGKFHWSLYATGGMILFYIIALLPLWFRNPNPVIFFPCDFVAVGCYLLFINLMTDGNWFLSFAFPVVGMSGVIVTTVIALTHYVKRGYFFIFGGTLIACGGYLVLLEFFLYITFHLRAMFLWSLYPLIACCAAGLALIVIGCSRPLRESFAKKFFI